MTALGCTDEQGLVVDLLILKGVDSCRECRIGLVQSVSENCGECARGVFVATGLPAQAAVVGNTTPVKVVDGQLFSDAHSLEVHTEDVWDAGARLAIVS